MNVEIVFAPAVHLFECLNDPFVALGVLFDPVGK